MVRTHATSVADRSVAVMADFTTGANRDGKHWFGVNWGRDAELPEQADLRNVVEGDPSPDGGGTIRLARNRRAEDRPPRRGITLNLCVSGLSA